MAEQRKVAIGMSIDWDQAVVTFSEQAQGGIAILNPPTIPVPLALIVRVALEKFSRDLPPGIRQINFDAQLAAPSETTPFDAKRTH